MTLTKANQEARRLGFTLRRNKIGLIEMKYFGKHSCWHKPWVYLDLQDALYDAANKKTAAEARRLSAIPDPLRKE